MVECQLPKLDVAGSSPVARSIQTLTAAEPARVNFLVPTYECAVLCVYDISEIAAKR